MAVAATVSGNTVILTTVNFAAPMVFTPGTSPIEPYYTAVQLNSGSTLLDVIGHTVTNAGTGTSKMPYSNVLLSSAGKNTDTIVNQAFDRYQSDTNEEDNYDDNYGDYGAARERGEDNNYAGWYVDDVEVGFAERGEMATIPSTDTSPLLGNENFTFNPNAVAGQITSGYYTLQIRRASDYGVYNNILPKLTITNTFDVNEQLSDSLSMTVPDANDVSNGETFSISDGVNVVTFQYLGEGVNDAVANPNYQPIYFTVDETTAEIATATAAAINLANTRGLFDVEATAGGIPNAGIQFQAVDGADITSQSTFTITDQNGIETTFELTSTGKVTAGDVGIDYTADDSAADIAEEIAVAINNAHLSYTATPLGPSVAFTGTGLVFNAGKTPLIETSVGDVAGIYLFQAAYVKTSWTAPTVAADLPVPQTEQTVQYNLEGDVWTVMDQGEDIIEQNSILNSANYGILVAGVPPTPNGSAADPTPTNGATPQPAPIGDDPSSQPYSVAVLRGSMPTASSPAS